MLDNNQLEGFKKRIDEACIELAGILTTNFQKEGFYVRFHKKTVGSENVFEIRHKSFKQKLVAKFRVFFVIHDNKDIYICLLGKVYLSYHNFHERVTQLITDFWEKFKKAYQKDYLIPLVFKPDLGLKKSDASYKGSDVDSNIGKFYRGWGNLLKRLFKAP